MLRVRFPLQYKKYEDQDTQIYSFVFVLYGYDSWSLKLREEHRLRLLERRELKEIFGLKWDEVTGEWRDRMIREDLCSLYALPNIRVIKSRKNQMGETCGTYGVQERYIQGFDRQTRRKTTWKTYI